jgi:hypothetical protein
MCRQAKLICNALKIPKKRDLPKTKPFKILKSMMILFDLDAWILNEESTNEDIDISDDFHIIDVLYNDLKAEGRIYFFNKILLSLKQL